MISLMHPSGNQLMLSKGSISFYISLIYIINVEFPTRFSIKNYTEEFSTIIHFNVFITNFNIYLRDFIFISKKNSSGFIDRDFKTILVTPVMYDIYLLFYLFFITNFNIYLRDFIFISKKNSSGFIDRDFKTILVTPVMYDIY